MADPRHLHLRAKPPRVRAAENLSALALTSIQHGMDADTTEAIGRLMIRTAAEMRAAGFGKVVAHA